MQTEKILTSKEKFHIKPGLERVDKILKLLKNPQDNLKIIHIAGTNGKGSICAILEEILVQQGFKTGKFTSPHLFSYTERIAVNKIPIKEKVLDEIINKINNLDIEHKIGLTEFEILTAAGFLYFQKQKCDIAIIETGLGGRLDSTNIIKKPLVSIIGSISLEHTEKLGNTIEKIAQEKAGIIKKGCPVVFLKSNNGYKTLKKEAEAKKGVIYETEALTLTRKNNKNYALIDDKKIQFSLNGDFQGENLALALKAIDIINKNKFLNKKISKKTVHASLKEVKWRFRLEEINSFELFNIQNTNYDPNKKILIDACHNPDGARVLREYLDKNYKDKKIKFLFGCLKNKNYEKILEFLFSIKSNASKNFYELDPNKKLYFYEFNYPNALKFKELPPIFQKIAKQTEEPILELLKCEDCDLAVVCGSIYMLGQIFANNLQ